MFPRFWKPNFNNKFVSCFHFQKSKSWTMLWIGERNGIYIGFLWKPKSPIHFIQPKENKYVYTFDSTTN